jgi:hypothetical protein
VLDARAAVLFYRNMKTSPFVAFLFAVSLYAAGDVQELAQYAAKYKADCEAVSGKQSTAIERAARSYGLALDTAERSATAAGDIKTVGIVTAERDAIKARSLAAREPKYFPQNLLPARKAYLETLAKLDAEKRPQMQKAAADYLRALASLQSRAQGNPELIAQIEAAKKSVVQGAVPLNAAKIAGSKWTLGGERMVFTLNAGGTSTSKWWWKITGENEVTMDVFNTPLTVKGTINGDATEIRLSNGEKATRIAQ